MSYFQSIKGLLAQASVTKNIQTIKALEKKAAVLAIECVNAYHTTFIARDKREEEFLSYLSQAVAIRDLISTYVDRHPYSCENSLRDASVILINVFGTSK